MDEPELCKRAGEGNRTNPNVQMKVHPSLISSQDRQSEIEAKDMDLKHANRTIQILEQQLENAETVIRINQFKKGEIMKEQLTLGQLIFLPSRIKPDATVRFDFGGFKPTTIDSYRGYYDQLAIGFSNDAKTTVAQLLADCKSAIGKTFQGYKGGEYVMHSETDMWVANYGNCHDTALVGVIDNGYEAILETANLMN